MLPIHTGEGGAAELRLERRPSPFTDDERGAAEAVAGFASAALRRLLREQELELRLEHEQHARRQAVKASEEARRIEAFTASLAASTHTEPASIVEAAVSAAGAESGVIATLADDEHGLELLASVGYPLELGGRRRLDVRAAAPLARAASSSLAVFVRDTPLLPGAESGSGGARVSACLPLTVEGATLGVLGITFGESVELDEHERSFLGSLAAIAAQALERSLRATLHERTTRLHQVTVRLAGVITANEVADVIVREGIAALDARAGAVALLTEEQELELAAASGYPDELVAELARFPVDAGLLLAEATRTRQTVLVESAAAACDRDPTLRSLVRRFGDHAVVALPLVVRDEVLGAVAFTFAEPRIFDRYERAFFTALSQLGAQALDRNRRAHAYDRTARLQAVTVGLSQASTPADVARVVVEEGMPALGASGASVALLGEDGGTLELIEMRGYPRDLLRDWRRFPADAPVPLAAAAAGETVVASSPAVIADRWPAVAALQLGHAALVAMPLRGRDGVFGAVAFTFAEERELREEDERFVQALAELCAQALERSRLFAAVQSSRDRLRQLLEALHEGIVAVTPTLEVFFANDEAAHLLGEPDLRGATLPEPWSAISLRAVARDLLLPGASWCEVRAELEDGRTVEVAGIPQHDGAVLVVRDVSARERRERAEREFVANAAHELRTPLAAISGALDALEMGAKEDRSSRDAFLTGIESEVDRLTRLVRALLLLAAAQADPSSLLLERVDLAPLVTEVARLLEVRPGVRVETDCTPVGAVRGERALLEAVLLNVARNASRHTKSGTIRFSCAAAADDRVAVEVADTGAGMAPDVRARAFERFYRGGPRDRDGFGLGLPLASEMVTLLGGEIGISSRPGAGTTVRILLPTA